MTNVIHLLPDHISNQIAAGEVIQRPSSAVKELMENSIDSNATHIKLIIKNAGKSLVQVIDDGGGMSETDARMCFEKHATSKIESVDDLFSIKTKGFRGEALASIAAISQVELKTKKEAEQTGSRLLIEGSEVISHQPCTYPKGTCVTVRNLFYNVPARRKFLKSNTAEIKNIIDEFQRVCLAHPEISFSFFNDEKLVYDLKASNLRKRIVNLLGDNYNERLVPVEEFTDYVKVKGFIGKAEFARKTRGEQFLFVNNRFIKSKYLNHSIYKAYEEIIQKDSYPMFILFLEINPSRIDVNVHPSKHEVKFDDERLVYTIINAAVKHALAQYSITPSLDFEVEQGFGSLPGFHPERENSGSIKHFKDFHKKEAGNWEALYPQPNPADVMILENGKDQNTGPKFNTGFNPLQLHSRYILTQIKSGLVIIDQQSAHERILFEEFKQKLDKRKFSKQQLLFPKKISLSPHDAEIILRYQTELNDLGIEIEKFGENSFIIQAIPPELRQDQIEDVIEQIIAHFNLHKDMENVSVHNTIAKSMAFSAAIKRGESLSKDEMQNLIDRLFACQNPNTNPNKHRCFIQIDLNEIEKKFTYA